MTLGLLLQTEDLIAERRAVRVADVAAATQAALQTLERLQAVAAALGAPAGGPAGGPHIGNAATAAAAVADTVDTADIQQQLLAASGSIAGGGGAASALPALVSADTAAPAEPMLGPGLAAVRLGDEGVADLRMVACDKATDILGAPRLRQRLRACDPHQSCACERRCWWHEVVQAAPPLQPPCAFERMAKNKGGGGGDLVQVLPENCMHIACGLSRRNCTLTHTTHWQSSAVSSCAMCCDDQRSHGGGASAPHCEKTVRQAE